MSDSGPTKIPSVVFDLADVLPQFQGADLESQLQTFDYFIDMLSPEVRPAFASILRGAAAKTHDAATQRRIAAAAQSIAEGGRAAAPYNHEEAMRAYRAQHAANYSATPVHSASGRQVDENEYSEAIRQADAVKDPTLKRRTIGEVERWIAPDGRVVAWLVVRYFKGEHDYDYYIAN